MNSTTLSLQVVSAESLVNAAERSRLLKGVAVGLLAASIGALYTVVARWGIVNGLQSPDLTVLRFGIAGIITLPILFLAWQRGRQELLSRWKIWAAISVLAGTPFGLLMFGALQLAPPSHAAVFPFASMSVMGMLISAWVLGDKITSRKAAGIAIVLAGLLILSGVDAASFSGRALTGDAMFIAAGALWASFGVLLRKHKLDPLLATAVVSFSALLTYVPAYLLLSGGQRLIDAAPHVFWIEVLVQGVIAGAGTLYTYAKMVSLLGPARAALFPALAPGLAALMAWPVLAHVPTFSEAAGLSVAMAGLIIAVTNSINQRPTR
jgi:drug/metabolite transporter (DMT)-like permease